MDAFGIKNAKIINLFENKLCFQTDEVFKFYQATKFSEKFAEVLEHFHDLSTDTLQQMNLLQRKTFFYPLAEKIKSQWGLTASTFINTC